jgi:hypothetical protein
MVAEIVDSRRRKQRRNGRITANNSNATAREHRSGETKVERGEVDIGRAHMGLYSNLSI